MTTLTDRPNTALLVIDLQNAVTPPGTYNRDIVLKNVNTLIDKARAEGVPVIWVQHSDEDNMPKGSPDWEYVPELTVGADEPVVHKLYGDSFEATDLEEQLASRGVGRLVVTGAETDACIRSTIHGAFTRGYDTTLVGDAHTTGDLSEYGAPTPEAVVSNVNLYWRFQAAPGRKARVVETGEVTFTAEEV